MYIQHCDMHTYTYNIVTYEVLCSLYELQYLCFNKNMSNALSHITTFVNISTSVVTYPMYSSTVLHVSIDINGVIKTSLLHTSCISVTFSKLSFSTVKSYYFEIIHCIHF